MLKYLIFLPVLLFNVCSCAGGSVESSTACGLEVVHPDDIDCDDGLHFDEPEISADKADQEGSLILLYMTLRGLSPGLEGDCQTELFFKNQDLRFGERISGVANAESTMRISAVGDLMVRDQLDDTNSAHLYEDVQDELFGADIVFGNLETPAHPQLESLGPPFNLSAEATRVYLAVGREHGFDIVSTANNHALDQGEDGLRATLDHLDDLGVMHVGSSRSMEERDEGFPIIDRNGVKVAFLAYTFSVNAHDVPQERGYIVNLVNLNTLDGPPDLGLIQAHTEAARRRGADAVVVSLHWGVEHVFYPARRFIDLAHRIADLGADVILGHHPHILNPLERYVPAGRAEGVPEVLIAYSLGNFLSYHINNINRTSIILHLELSKGTLDGEPRVWISDVHYTPVWWYEDEELVTDHRVIQIDSALADRNAYSFLPSSAWDALGAARQYLAERFETCRPR